MTGFEIATLVLLALILLKKTNHTSELNALLLRLEEADRRLSEIRAGTDNLEMIGAYTQECAQAAGEASLDYAERNRDPDDPRY